LKPCPFKTLAERAYFHGAFALPLFTVSVMQICIILNRVRGENAMATLTVTARGQVTFRKDVLKHLGVRPGDKIELELLPDRRVSIHTARPKGSIEDFIGFLAGKTKKVATIEEINEATARGWAGIR
jgi:bifunctional DNA-binding transcriptional regulator/antitoxin component of YhaV-PrlF toxin-antitoxin module